MAELKTKATKQSAADFIKSVKPESKQKDCLALLKIFQKATGKKPVMWGTSIVGFGRYHYKSTRSSQEGDWPLSSFSPRKQNFTLYIMTGLMSSKLGVSSSKAAKNEQTLLKKLGKYKVGGGCLYINKLADVDQKVLAALVEISFRNSKLLMTKAGFEVFS
jgi:hypothetical protein